MATRWKILLEWDGTDFCGWQVQPGERSIQGTLSEALSGLLNESVSISASGRTDAGVHALGQVASFVTGADRTARAIRDGLNSKLPEDIAVLEAAVVPIDFDPRRWVMRKTYRYRFLTRPSRSPHRDRFVWRWGAGLDVDRMQEAAHHLEGRHDFSSFRASGCQAAHPVRVIESITVRQKDDEVWLAVTGNGFLRHMVRIIAGTLHEVGRGRRSPEWVSEVLAARSRTDAGRTAPARGLALVAVELGDRKNPWTRLESED